MQNNVFWLTNKQVNYTTSHNKCFCEIVSHFGKAISFFRGTRKAEI